MDREGRCVDRNASRGGAALPSGSCVSSEGDPPAPNPTRRTSAAKTAVRWVAENRGRREALVWWSMALIALPAYWWARPSTAVEAPVWPGLAQRVPAGKLAFPVPVESSVPLLDGDRVDLFPDHGAELGALVSVLVLDARSPREPILALSHEQIRWVETARQKGKLKVAVRGETEKGGASIRRAPRRKQSVLAIPIWESE